MVFGIDIGIDLGIVIVLVYVKGKGIVLRELLVVVIEQIRKQILVVGEEVRCMIGRILGNIVVVRFFCDGVIFDYEVIEVMLKYFLGKVFGKRVFFKLRVVVCVLFGVIEVEKRVVLDVIYEVGVKQIFLIEEFIVVVIGVGFDILKLVGCMVIDIGGGIIDIVVIFFGGVVVSEFIKVVGDKFDEVII